MIHALLVALTFSGVFSGKINCISINFIGGKTYQDVDPKIETNGFIASRLRETWEWRRKAFPAFLTANFFDAFVFFIKFSIYFLFRVYYCSYMLFII